MDTLNQPLNALDYADQFFKQYAEPLITVQETGPASDDLAALPANQDSLPPQGPPTDGEAGDSRAGPLSISAAAAEEESLRGINARIDAAPGFNIDNNVLIGTGSTVAATAANQTEVGIPLPSPPPPPAPAPRAQRASAARAGALWNSEYVAAVEKADEDAYLASSGAKSKKNEAHRNKKQQTAATGASSKKQKTQHNNAAPAAPPPTKQPKAAKDGDADYIAKSVVYSKAALLAPPRESKRQRQKPLLYRDEDIWDIDTALLQYEFEDDAGYQATMVASLIEKEADLLRKIGDFNSIMPAAEGDEKNEAPAALVVPSAGSLERKSKRIAAAADVLKPKSTPMKKQQKQKLSKKASGTRSPTPNKKQNRSSLTPSPRSIDPAPAPVAPPAQPVVIEAATPPPLSPPPPSGYQKPSIPPNSLKQDDVLLGCNKCRYTKTGCIKCRERAPAFTRPPNRWDPFNAHHQVDIPAIPSFRPTKEEFVDPVAYITKIMPEAMKYGLAHIIPPEDWDPPFALEKGTNGVSMESFKFAIRKQLTSHLCYRSAPSKKQSGVAAAVAAEDGGGEAAAGEKGDSRYGNKKNKSSSIASAATKDTVEPPSVAVALKKEEEEEEVEETAEAMATIINTLEEPLAAAPVIAPTLTADDILAALAAANSGEDLDVPQPQQEEAGEEADEEEEEEENAAGLMIAGELETVPMMGDFGFVPLEKKQTLRSFAAYADWAKAIHFSDPPPLGTGTPSAPKRRPLKLLPVQHSAPVEPSVEEIEAEFWRIVETPDTYLETLYGQDLDSGHHGSGFPLPEWRRRLLETHLTTTKNNKLDANDGEVNPSTNNINQYSPSKTSTAAAAAAVQLPPPSTEAEIFYSNHPWNINNMPRSKSSMLRYLLGDGLITGVMVPWLYVGSCLSAFCWHVEDHALYSVNYHHLGAPKVWYGVPANATLALEEAMRDALPHLFDSNPGLLHQLVTTLSPMELKKRGVPVYRVVHEAGSFVVTMPDAYHSGFNTGFNCAEAVNFAAPGWIPFGTDISQKYRDAVRPVTMSHDSLLVALATAAQHVATAKGKKKVAEKGRESAATTNTLEKGDTTDKNNSGEQEKNDTLVPPPSSSLPPTTTAASTNPAATAAAAAVQKQANGFGPLGDIPWADAPLDGIILGTGELALRAAEEKERWATGAQALINLKEPLATTTTSPSSSLLDVLPCRTMDPCTSKPCSKDPVTGVYEDTAECDCAECQGDLWLAAVVSSAAPDVAVCPEHAAALVHKHNCPLDSLVLLCRYSPSDLQQLVDVAVEKIDGAEEAVAAAHARRRKLEAERVRAVPVGALYPTNKDGECIGSVAAAVPNAYLVMEGAGDADGAPDALAEAAAPADAGTALAAPPSQRTVKKRGKKPKKKRTYHFKKQKKNAVIGVNILPSAPPSLPLPPPLPSELEAAVVASGDAGGEPGAVDTRRIEPRSDVEMLPPLPPPPPQQQQQQNNTVTTSGGFVGVYEIAEFAAVLRAKFEQQEDQAPIIISGFINNAADNNTSGSFCIEDSLQPSTAAGAATAAALDGSTAPPSGIFVSGRGATSISEVVPMSLDEFKASLDFDQAVAEKTGGEVAVAAEMPFKAPAPGEVGIQGKVADNDATVRVMMHQNEEPLFNLNSDV